MKIIFDYKIFYQQKIGGISNYFFNLGEEFLRRNHDLKFICPIHKNKYLNKIKAQNKKAFFFKFLPSQANKLYENINHNYSNKFIKQFVPDIVHESYYSKKNYNNKTKIVCTVYDMINEIYPKYSKASKEITQMKFDTVNRADKIFCISHKTKRDLIEYFNINENKIKVSYLSSGFEDINFIQETKKEFSDCLLFVGSRYGYKNYENLIRAYAISKILRNNFRIIFFGGEKPGSYEFDVIKKNKLNFDQILFFDDNDYDLSYIYTNVLALIYPSLYEGFGIPILEAMSLGCPVISSKGGALTEVGGEGIPYFDPQSVEDLSFKIENTLNSTNSLKEIIEYGLKRSKEFSWKNCADQTLNGYKEI